MDTKKKKSLILIGILVLVLGILLYSSFPTRKELIKTPSSHEKVEYLNISDDKLSDKYKVEFVLYDPECKYIQICIAVPKGDRELWQAEALRFTVDEGELGKYSMIQHTEFWKDYYIFLLQDITEFERVKVEYEGKVVEAGRAAK